MGEELEMFLCGEEMSEEQVMSLLDFKIRPAKSWEEEKCVYDSCLEMKEMVTNNKRYELPEEFGVQHCGLNMENIFVLLEILADFDVLTNISKEDTLILHNGLFFFKWIISSYPENIGAIQSNYSETWNKFSTLLLNVITKLEVFNENYHLVMEATDILTIASYAADTLDVIGVEKELITSLLKNFIAQKPAPVFPYNLPSGVGHALASGMWSVMTVG